MYCIHHVRLKRVRISTVAVEKQQVLDITNVCLFLPRSRGHTNCTFSPSYHIVPHLLNGTIFEKLILNINVFFFNLSASFVQNISDSEKH